MMTASGGRLAQQMSPDVDKYFSMLKEQFSLDGLKRSSSAGNSRENRSIVFRNRFDSLSSDISHKYHRHSMVEGGNLFVSKQRSLDSSLTQGARGLLDSNHRLSTSLTDGGFRDLINNNEFGVDDLQSRHMEMALNQGKLNSVSEENRKRRRKVFEKERKASK